MTNRNTEIRVSQANMNYRPRYNGSHVGEPTVEIKLSANDDNIQSIGAVDNLMDRWGWKQKTRSGFARTLVRGTDPLAEMHREGLQAFDDIISPRFIDFQIDGRYLDKQPPRYINRMADHFSVFVPDEDLNTEVLAWFGEQASKFGHVDFFFPVSSSTDEQYVSQISTQFNLYDSDVYLYPKGRKAHTVANSMEYAEAMAKRNTWNVSPRLDILLEYEEDE